jgi:hypothetical protein
LTLCRPVAIDLAPWDGTWLTLSRSADNIWKLTTLAGDLPAILESASRRGARWRDRSRPLRDEPDVRGQRSRRNGKLPDGTMAAKVIARHHGPSVPASIPAADRNR